jgi:hypothetical protein
MAAQHPQHRCKGCQVANHQQESRGCPDNQEGRQEGNQEGNYHQKDHPGASHKQQHCKLQQMGQAPQGTSEAMRGAPPDIFNGEWSQTSKFMLQFQIWWMVINRAEAIINPFQRITLCLSFIRGKRVDRWVEEKINQLR